MAKASFKPSRAVNKEPKTPAPEVEEVGGVLDRLEPETSKAVKNALSEFKREEAEKAEEEAAIRKANAPELRRLTVMLEKDTHRDFKVSCLAIELDMREAVSEFVDKFLVARAKHPTHINIMDLLTFEHH